MSKISKEVQARADAKRAGRKRNFATVFYPESVSEDWKNILSDLHIPIFISPFHDKDKNSTGEPKKPHFHVLFMFDAPKTKEQVKAIIESISGVGCEDVNTLRGYARYLCHLDNPEKEQYNSSDVISMGGADYRSVIGLATDKYIAIGEMIDFCEENDLYSYCKLLTYARFNREDWFRVLCDNGTMVMIQYLKSRSWTNERCLK